MLRFRFLRSTAFRLALVYALLFFVAVAALLAFVYFNTVNTLERQANATIRTELAGLTELYREGGLVRLSRAIADRQDSETARDIVYLLVDQGGGFVSGNLLIWPSGLTQPDALRDLTVDLLGVAEIEGDQARAMYVDLQEGAKLLVGVIMNQRAQFRRLIGGSLAWASAATVAFGAVGGWLVSRGVRRRLEVINRTTREIVEGDLKRRVPMTGADDEFDRLAGNLNSMLGEIDRLIGEIRSITDNIAHDLRRPLTHLRGRLELALLQARQPQEYRSEMQTAIAATDELIATFNALLSIAQVEAKTDRQAMEPVDLTTLCGDLIELYAPLAEERGHDMHEVIAAGVTIPGNRHLLFQCLANLLDNAIKYTPSGGRIALTLTAAAAGQGPSVRVDDSGPGIPAEEREHVLQRFVRLDASRSAPGSGLGLSVVAAVAKYHSAALELGDNGPGLAVILRFPVA
jgi:signal transduction histidine kinase